jgi:hypothetical protein
MRKILCSALMILIGCGSIGVACPALAVSSTSRAAQAAGYNLPVEPDEFDRREVEAYYDWRSNLFFRLFDLSGSEGKPTFMTARRTYKVTTSQLGYEVAVTFANPLFYWLDRNGNGEFEPNQDEMWIDIEEDGLNGNEKLYDPMNLKEDPRGPVPVPPVPFLGPREKI